MRMDKKLKKRLILTDTRKQKDEKNILTWS